MGDVEVPDEEPAGPPSPRPRASAPAALTPEHPDFRPRFARSGDTFIAWHALGDGDLDIVLVPGWVFPMRSFFDGPLLRAELEALARIGRVIVFDKRGTGLSDRASGVPSLEQRADDLSAVLDAAGSRQAILVGISEGGPLCLLRALAAPERTRGLALVGSFARWSRGPGDGHGWSATDIARLRAYIERAWGQGETQLSGLASHAGDTAIAAWAARAELLGASPGAALALVDMNAAIDVRPLLTGLRVPTLVLHQENDPVISFEHARELAAGIPSARLRAVPGRDHLFTGSTAHHLVDAVAELAREPATGGERFLTTVLALAAPGEPAASSEPAASGALAAHPRVHAALLRHRGEPGGGLSFCFDGPERAVRCGRELARELGVAAAVHTGQVERVRGALVGDGVDGARALARAATPGELWVSPLVRDIVAGSPLAFEPRTNGTAPDSPPLTPYACVADHRSTPAPPASTQR